MSRWNINKNMSADDMGYAHWVMEKAGGTNPLRQPYLQQKHRNLYKQYLRSQGKTEADIANAVEGKAATHFLDMVAGGDPAKFSVDPSGNPILGDTEINSYIGNQWTQKGRAASLRQEAEQMRKTGLAGERMHVNLKPCD
ncbi:polymorphic toxin type 15 domain-containing protein [Rhizobium tumorigenes]|uniref:Polymorphic toxin type 15 domain-containing protein n=1 Tax=Rhizobium tumorigenes TaxID=2041385 RepID=A0AAF1KAQ4_9HYPH|nr:polymorphic toxin type 15 domain-containing protein [Rhizobium tumorigenes]WFR98765.1 polymorphic toxin type 15 domain-containing protein [Rhizobium tumorigenes]